MGTDIPGEVNMNVGMITMDPGRMAGMQIDGGGLPGVLNAAGSVISGDVNNAGAMHIYPSATTVFTGPPSGLWIGDPMFGPVGNLTVSGTLDMYGAQLQTDGLFLIGNGGTVRTHGGSGGSADDIAAMGGFTNNGILEFVDGLHVLNLLSTYTQLSGGTLRMRVANGGLSDLLNIPMGGGVATLGGTLQITTMGSVNPGQTWTLITSNPGINGAFSNPLWPQDGNPAWRMIPGGNTLGVGN